MTEMHSKTNCPTCGEGIKPSWRLCPACETRLDTLACPLCKTEVKENWRRCPECEALLICRECGKRLAIGQPFCAACGSSSTGEEDPGEVFKDPVCGIEFVLVCGGVFMMGDTLNQGVETEGPVHGVDLEDFYMARYPVTQTQWGVLMKDNPSGFQKPDNPVEQVTWADAREFARKLTEAVKSPVRFLLPSEAQWEYAARSGGRDDLYSGGKDINTVAWYEANSQSRTHPVGQKKPNGLGLYDMSGNVWEWCEDTFLADAYALEAKKNPLIKDPGPDRVIRGGSWNLDAWSARCTRRFNFPVDFFGPGLGFRLIMVRH
ncbi:MAG: SUMF1/EgtB/PvdO family nonheme iron enzyme [Proteobacteria bacterium]|nr:SUMF1/EgtB/PvdO family nonheme iron enzyme [Pseudomonadota bacterium]